MKRLTASAASLVLLICTPAFAAEASNVAPLTIARSGSQPPSKERVEYFTGSVRVDPLFTAHDPSRTNGAYVTFEPGARSAWHSHPPMEEVEWMEKVTDEQYGR
jgi:hypothetical protein